MDKSKLKVVFIDWYKTLSSSMFYVDMKNYDEELCKKYRTKTFVECEHLLEDWLRGKISTQDIISSFASGEEEFKQAFEILKNSCENMVFDSPRFPALIKKIRNKGCRVVIATDNMDVFTQFVVPSLSLSELFDGILSSNLNGCKKRDVVDGRLVFFEDYLQRNGLNYEDAVLIDDVETTVELCGQYGLHGICVKSPQDVEQILENIAG